MSVSTAYNSPKEAECLSFKARRCTEEKITQVVFTPETTKGAPTPKPKQCQPLAGGRRQASRKRVVKFADEFTDDFSLGRERQHKAGNLCSTYSSSRTPQPSNANGAALARMIPTPTPSSLLDC